VVQQIDDTMLFTQGNAYHDALDIYAQAQSVSRRDPALHEAIAAFEAFLSTGPHAAHTTEPDPTTKK
jgi:hypothetical protein